MSLIKKNCYSVNICAFGYVYIVGANVNTCTTSNDHTVLSLACAGGHLSVVQYLLMQNADVGHMLKVGLLVYIYVHIIFACFNFCALKF